MNGLSHSYYHESKRRRIRPQRRRSMMKRGGLSMALISANVLDLVCKDHPALLGMSSAELLLSLLEMIDNYLT